MAAILKNKLNSVSQYSLIVENSQTQARVEFIFPHGSFLTTREVPHNTGGSIFVTTVHAPVITIGIELVFRK